MDISQKFACEVCAKSAFVSMQDGTVLDEKDVASLSLVDAVVHHASLAQRPSQTKVESTGGQQTSSDGDRPGERDSVANVKQENAGISFCSSIFLLEVNYHPVWS